MSAVASGDGAVFRATTETAGAVWASVFLDVPSFLLCGAQEVHELPGVVVGGGHTGTRLLGTEIPKSSHVSNFVLSKTGTIVLLWCDFLVSWSVSVLTDIVSIFFIVFQNLRFDGFWWNDIEFVHRFLHGHQIVQ